MIGERMWKFIYNYRAVSAFLIFYTKTNQYATD